MEMIKDTLQAVISLVNTLIDESQNYFYWS